MTTCNDHLQSTAHFQIPLLFSQISNPPAAYSHTQFLQRIQTKSIFYLRATMTTMSSLNSQNSQNSLVPYVEMHNCRSVHDLHKIVAKYNVGEDAEADTRVAAAFHTKVRVVVVTNVTKLPHSDVPIARWHKQGLEVQALTVRRLMDVFPWMKRFEGGWVAKLFLSRCVNNKVNEAQRKMKQAKGRFQLLLLLRPEC
jgi:hypothetical protein